MSIVPSDVILEEEDTEEDRTEKKQKFLEKRKTYDFHEYPVHPLNLNVADEEEEEAGEKKEAQGDNELDEVEEEVEAGEDK